MFLGVKAPEKNKYRDIVELYYYCASYYARPYFPQIIIIMSPYFLSSQLYFLSEHLGYYYTNLDHYYTKLDRYI